MLENVKNRSHYVLKVMPLVLMQVSVWAPAEGGRSTGGGNGITGLVANITGSLNSIMELAAQIGFVAGFFFVLASVMKFKQHKDNPTQVPVGTPISMLVMGTALMFAGNFIAPLGESIFGSADEAGVHSSGISSGLRESSSGSRS